MKTFREYINLIESAQHGEPLAEGVMDRLRRIYMGLVYDRPWGTPDSEFLSQWQQEVKAQLGRDIDMKTLARLQQNFRERGQTMMSRGDWAAWEREMGITEQGVAEGSLEEVDRRGFLRGLAAFAAVSAVPSGVVRALSTPEGINTLTTNDVNALLKAIRAYLPRYDQEDWTGTFERWDKMASVLRIHGDDNELGSDKLDKLMRLYRKDPEQASTKLLQHLQKHAVDLTDVRKQTISQWDDVETVRRSDPVNDEIRQMQQQIADYNARMQRSKIPGISSAQTATVAVNQFRDLVQQMLGRDTTISQPPREKYMGRIEPTSSALALPAPDRSATEIMRDLQDIMDRPLTDQEKVIVQREIIAAKKLVDQGLDVRTGSKRIKEQGVTEGSEEVNETQQVEEDHVARITRLHRELSRR